MWRIGCEPLFAEITAGAPSIDRIVPASNAREEAGKVIFKDEKRNNRMRIEILNYFISSVTTDDERAEVLGLPKGCRILERAKIIPET